MLKNVYVIILIPIVTTYTIYNIGAIITRKLINCSTVGIYVLNIVNKFAWLLLVNYVDQSNVKKNCIII